MKTTKITIGRLFNLGSYEHMRYEITVEIPSSESASDAMIGLEKILEALKPERQCMVKTEAELERESFRLEELKKDLASLGVDEFEQKHGWHIVGTAPEYIQRVEDGYRREVEKRVAYEKRAKCAREALDDIGGAATWKDAKLDWETDGDF
jgi:hypothetical protein